MCQANLIVDSTAAVGCAAVVDSTAIVDGVAGGAVVEAHRCRVERGEHR